MSKSGMLNRLHKPGKKTLIGFIILVAIVAAVLLWTDFFGGDKDVGFTVLNEADLPQQIVSQVIPEYRQMERALACIIDNKVYVIATRGEKPTSGYEITIDKMKMTDKDGVKKLEVYTQFKDPDPNTALTQVLTYPMQIAETDLTALPEKIELKVKYND